MEYVTLSAKETAEVLGIALSSVYELKASGKLKPCKNLPGIKFRKKDVLALVELGTEYGAFEYQRLKRSHDTVQQENAELKRQLLKLAAEVNLMCSQLVKEGNL